MEFSKYLFEAGTRRRRASIREILIIREPYTRFLVKRKRNSVIKFLDGVWEREKKRTYPYLLFKATAIV